jgi:serine/threonine protein kinase
MYTDITGQIEINSVIDRIKKIGGGTYGTIFLGDSGAIYKRITMQRIKNVIPDKNRNYLNELFHRELFIEAFVQTLLQSDTKYGKNIARLDGIYKDGIVDETNNLPLSQRKYTYFYKMENVPYTFPGFVKTLTNVTSEMASKFQEIGAILEYFMDTYGFFHRDLHGGNIMFDTSGNIKLIDFGMSCIDVNGIQYSVNNDECMSFDLFVLITYLLEQNIIPELNDKFKELLSDRQGFDIFELMKRFTGPMEHVFHKSYYSFAIKPKNQPWSNATTTRFIENILPRLDPKGFVQFWKDYETSLVPVTVKANTPNISKTISQFGYAPELQRTIPLLKPEFKLDIPAYRTMTLPVKGGKTRKLRKKKSRSLA